MAKVLLLIIPLIGLDFIGHIDEGDFNFGIMFDFSQI